MKRSHVLVKAVILVLIALGWFGCGGGSSGLNEDVAKLTLSADPSSIPADSISFSTITAVLTDGNGSPARIGTAVSFSTNLGVFSNNQKAYDTIIFNEDGEATATLIAGLTPGTATITCSAGGASAIVKVEIRSF